MEVRSHKEVAEERDVLGSGLKGVVTEHYRNKKDPGDKMCTTVASIKTFRVKTSVVWSM